MNASLDFSNSVHTNGYVWVPGADWNLVEGKRWQLGDGEPVFRVREPWNERGADTPRILLCEANRIMHNFTARRSVRPTAEDSALYRNFSAVEPNEAEIINFANRYGQLWDDMAGIPFAEWEYEIRTMRFLIDVWDAVAENKLSRIASHFRPDKTGKSLMYPFSGSLNIYPEYRKPPLHKGAGAELYDCSVGQMGPLKSVAAGFVRNAINARLHVLVPVVELSPVGRHWRLTMRPDSLLGAMWLQFAESVSVESKYRQCEVCGRYMEMSPDANRADRRFCGNACRNKAARRRKKQAIELRSAGKTLREIAKAVGSDVKTVKKWIAENGDAN